jgi:DNA-binding transcriptional MerR regulator
MTSSLPDAENSGPDTGYTVEVLSSITGISIQTIVLYQEHGLIRPVSEKDSLFDDETVRALRRFQHLCETCAVNLTGLKLLASLLDEVEKLRAALAARH